MSNFEEKIVQYPPKLKRTISTNVPDQETRKNCWAFALTKVIHKVFKNLLPDLENSIGDKDKCDPFYSLSNIKKLIISKKALTRNFCGTKEYKNLILYIFILLFLERSSSNFCPRDVNGIIFQSKEFFTDVFVRDFNAFDFCTIMSEDNMIDETRSLYINESNDSEEKRLGFLIYCNDINTIIFEANEIRKTNNLIFNTISYGIDDENYNIETLFEIVKRIIDDGLYLIINVKLHDDESISHSYHSMTIVDYNEDNIENKYLIVKNSWGKKNNPYKEYSLNELRDLEFLYIIWVEINEAISQPNEFKGGKKKYIKRKNKSKKKQIKRKNKSIKRRNSIKRKNK